ncbi:putative protease [Butyrivibrio sp. ob235]|nr:putative protease [Butyrivibrio sp. ob235]
MAAFFILRKGLSMDKVELLAPAGNYETMIGAFNAGADAVYLGGQGFGARAFADNFTDEEVIKAIRYAHLIGKKIYLTVNTLLKEKEIPAFIDFFAQFAYAGLDGAIIQDLGIFRIIRETFPWVELHVSTQMTITGNAGASLLMELGASRVVPARELSLDEIRQIHDNCKFPDGHSIEIEAFIHGAMCYCYSGACLFSSMVGERSGNRGRCAQPCRLPYRTSKNTECYALSLKDMCMFDRIPELIEAGIDSFKIEGRMKKPEYAAGVTSIYRKLIDNYYEQKSSAKLFEPGKIRIKATSEDKRILASLYLRSETGEGYYFKHNGADMVTLDSPAYNGSDDAVLGDIRNKYLTGEKKLPVFLKCKLMAGKEAELSLCLEKCAEIDENLSITAIGEIVQTAQKRPMSATDIEKQLSKFGNTHFELVDKKIEIDTDNIFIPNKALNELRRNAVCLLEDEICKFRGYSNEYQKKESKSDKSGSLTPKKNEGFLISVLTKAQLEEAVRYSEESENVNAIYIDSRIVLLNDELHLSPKCRNYISLPYITRDENFIDCRKEIKSLLDIAESKDYDGVLVRNLEQLSIIKEYKFKKEIITDYGLYIWNHEALSSYCEILKDLSFAGFNLPLELNHHEAEDLLSCLCEEKTISIDADQKISVGTMIYGRVPMMLTANCIKNTLKGCTGDRGKAINYENDKLIDRTGRILPVTCDCFHCYNIIWNSVPVSLFKKIHKLKSIASKYYVSYRLDFTTEKPEEVRDVLYAYNGLFFAAESDKNKYEKILSANDYTTGHFERSAD